MLNEPVYIVGRGIVGMCIAWHLSQRGIAVHLLGPAARAGTATCAAVGVSAMKGMLDPQQNLLKAKWMGHKRLKGWLHSIEKELGALLPYHDGKVYEPFTSPADYAVIRDRVFHRKFTGLLNFELLDAKAYLEQQPWARQLQPKIMGAFKFVNDIWFDPRATLMAMETVLRRRGAAFSDDEVIRVFDHSDRGLVIETSSRQIHGHEVVIAAGQFSAEILGKSGLPWLMTRPVSGETLVGEVAQGTSGVFIKGSKNLALDGSRFYFGSSSRADDEPRGGNSAISQEKELSEELCQRLPYVSIQTVFSGVRARFRDRMPATGAVYTPSGARRLWVAVGFYKNGLQLADLFAQNLVNDMLGAEASAFFSVFSPGRLPVF